MADTFNQGVKNPNRNALIYDTQITPKTHPNSHQITQF
jgi:hypothetical protein